MKKKIIALLILILVVVSVILLYARWGAQKPPSKVLSISGNIEAHESLVGFKVQGRLDELLVEEGQSVKEGDLIARLDGKDYLQQVNVDEAAVSSRQAELDLALAGSRTQEIKAAEQAVLDAQADVELKKIEFQRNQALYERNAGVSAEARDVAATNLKRSQATYERSKQTYDELVEGTRKEQIAINRANVNTAKQNLTLSRIRLEYTSLLAPKNGVVTVRQAELGEVMQPGTPVVTIADLDHLWLRGYVAETDLGKVRWGQSATVKTDTFPNKTYIGRVSFISSVAEFTPKSVETHKERVTLVYRIKIDLENPNHDLKPGMPADAEINVTAR
ncbi:MAG TPA: efflux RND transporter periplasmic adaptor subunit [Syntrophorhabdales bacterium]|nr:efflux RND transporter periplasmic adaptor subunit [Syntrophorhabdales bacterium]